MMLVLQAYSQLNCSYSYPSKPRLVVTVLGCTSMVSLSSRYSTCEPTRALHVHKLCIIHLFILRICASRRGK